MNIYPQAIKEEREIFLRDLNSCKKQADRLKYSLQHVEQWFPFSVEFVKNSSEKNIEVIDAFIFRFRRLQDTIGKRAFHRLMKIEEDESVSMIDVLNKMEKIGILENATSWHEIRNARNYATHDYVDDELQAVANNLNKVVAFSAELFAIISRIEQYATTKLKL